MPMPRHDSSTEIADCHGRQSSTLKLPIDARQQPGSLRRGLEDRPLVNTWYITWLSVMLTNLKLTRLETCRILFFKCSISFPLTMVTIWDIKLWATASFSVNEYRLGERLPYCRRLRIYPLLRGSSSRTDHRWSKRSTYDVHSPFPTRTCLVFCECSARF